MNKVQQQLTNAREQYVAQHGVRKENNMETIKKGYALKCRHFDSDSGEIDFEETIAVSEKEELVREKMNTLLAECFEDGWEKYNEGENFVSVQEGGESKEYEIEETIILA